MIIPGRNIQMGPNWTKRHHQLCPFALVVGWQPPTGRFFFISSYRCSVSTVYLLLSSFTFASATAPQFHLARLIANRFQVPTHQSLSRHSNCTLAETSSSTVPFQQASLTGELKVPSECAVSSLCLLLLQICATSNRKCLSVLQHARY